MRQLLRGPPQSLAAEATHVSGTLLNLVALDDLPCDMFRDI